MGELTVRRNRGVNPPSYPAAEKTEKTAGTARSRPAAKTPGFTVSETLRELTSRVGRAEGQTRESHRTLQMGEAVLAEVRDSLDRLAELAEKAASGGASGRAALQAELERLRGEIDRMTGGAMADGTRLFLDGEMDVDGAEESGAAAGPEAAGEDGAQALPDWLLKSIAQSGLTPERLLSMLRLDTSASGAELLEAVMGSSLENDPAAAALAALYLGAAVAGGGAVKAVDLRTALEGLRQLLEKVEEGMPPDQAVELLTGGAFTGFSDLEAQFTGGTAPGLEGFLMGLLMEKNGLALTLGSSMLAMLAGTEGMDLELLMGLLSAVQSSGEGLEAGIETASGEASAGGAAAGTAGAEAAPAPPVVLELEGARVTGKDLSGVSAGASDGEVAVSGTADVTVQGAGERTLLLSGSGTVTLRDADGTALDVDAPMAHVSVPEGAVLGEVRLRPGAALTLSGGGLTRLTALRAEGGNLLRLAGGAAAAEPEEGEALGTLPLPVVLDGPASLAARAASVRSADGKALDPFDVVWKTLLPGWDSISALAVNGRQTRLSLAYPEAMRLWLDKGDPSQGSPVQAVVIRGKDRSGQPKIRYAYLRWNESAGAFEEISMYPNPFTVTGGEAGEDWIYEEETHTLRILTSRVTAVTGGTGVDANQEPFSGRIALADGIGGLELALGGVDCRVSSGRAFSLGDGNQVTLVLERGTRNRFESGAGCAGISLGDGTSLRVDCPEDQDGGRTPVGTLTASGGGGGAGIGRDSGAGREPSGRIELRGGEITALGRGGGAGIGAGKRGAFGEILVLGGTVRATGEKGGGAGIGGGQDAPAGDIRIQGGTVSAAALGHAAAIGAGVRGACGDIAITGTARIVKALGGDPGADIGACLFGGCGEVQISGAADIGRARLWTRTGVSLRMGEETVTLPQFRLSSRALGLDQLSLATKEAAKAAQAVIDADRRRVAQIQTAYGVLYDRLERNACALRGVQRYFRETGLVRDAGAAGTLLEDARRSIPLSSGQAALSHGKRGKDDVRRLFR